MIAAYLEIRDGKIKKSSLEALSEAERRAAELGVGTAAVLVGSAVSGLAPAAFAQGAAKVYVIDNPLLADYSSQAYAVALAGFAATAKPAALFFAATAMGKDLAPRVAARLGVALATDCTKVAVKDGALEFTRPIYAGKAFLSLRLKSTPQLATLRPNVFPLGLAGAGAGETIRLDVAIPDETVKGRVTEVLKEESAELDVTEADVVISGGRGLKGPEPFGLLRDLAAVFPRAAVGASRSAVDSGWIGHQHQVGQTGKTVSPELYMAIGISGAIQHLAGMSSSKFIVAVNKDPEAPIFKVADYGIVGDLFEVVPKLTEELKKTVGGIASCLELRYRSWPLFRKEVRAPRCRSAALLTEGGLPRAGNRFSAGGGKERSSRAKSRRAELSVAICTDRLAFPTRYPGAAGFSPTAFPRRS